MITVDNEAQLRMLVKAQQKVSLTTMQMVLTMSKAIRGDGSHEAFERALEELIDETEKEIEAL